MKTLLLVSIFFSYLFITTSSIAQVAQGSSGEALYVPGEVIVRFAEGYFNREATEASDVESLVYDSDLRTRLKEVESCCGKFGYSIKKVFSRQNGQKSISRSGKQIDTQWLQNIVLLKVDDKSNIIELAKELSTVEGIIYAEPNYVGFIDNKTRESIPGIEKFNEKEAFRKSAFFSTPNDPEFSNQHSIFDSPIHLDDPDIGADEAWGSEVGNSATKVCVIDSGIDFDHPDLGNGVTGQVGAKVRDGWDYSHHYDDDEGDGDYDAVDDSHGTQVAGIIGAIRNNQVGIAGIAGGDATQGNNGVELYALKIIIDDDEIDYKNNPNQSDFESIDLGSAIVDGSTSNSSGGFGCHILSMSVGSPGNSLFYVDALGIAANNETIMVTSRGNQSDTSAHFPSEQEDPWMLSVGASTTDNLRLLASSYGGKMDVVAPGDDSMVYTTKALFDAPYGSFVNSSAATPHVSGVAALLHAKSQSLGLTLHPEDYEGIIQSSAYKPDGVSFNSIGWTPELGHGRLDAKKALEMLESPWQLNYHVSNGGSDHGQVGGVEYVDITAPGLTNPFGYRIIRHEVRKTISLPSNVEVHVWGRGVNESTGWPATTNEGQLVGTGYSEVMSIVGSNATLRTYVYKLWEVQANGSEVYIGWHPAPPSGVSMAYSTIQQPLPVSAICNGPTAIVANTPTNWSATVTGGTGPYEYLWDHRAFCQDEPSSSTCGDLDNAFGGSTSISLITNWSTLLRFTVTDANGNSAVCEKQVTVGNPEYPAEDPIRVSATAFLDGPYDSGNMNNSDLLYQNIISTSQPHFGYPTGFENGDMYYGGNESVPFNLFSVHPDIVDWVLVDLLAGDPSTGELDLEQRRAGFIKTDGSIVDINGVSPISFHEATNGDYYIAIRHRNHLSVMSPNDVYMSDTGGPYSHDFTGNSAYGTSPLRNLDPGVYGLKGGEANADGSITAFDFIDGWLPINGSSEIYDDGDFNMNNVGSAFDFSLVWLPSNGSSTQVPDISANTLPPAAQKAESNVEVLAKIGNGNGEGTIQAKLSAVTDREGNVRLTLKIRANQDSQLGAGTFGIKYDPDKLSFPDLPTEGEARDYRFHSFDTVQNSFYESTITQPENGFIRINIFLKERGRGTAIDRNGFVDVVSFDVRARGRVDLSEIEWVRCEVVDGDYKVLARDCRGFELPREVKMADLSFAKNDIEMGDNNAPAIISRAYPNPFNPTTTFTVKLSNEQSVRIDLYDQTGRLVDQLFDGIMTSQKEHPFVVNGKSLSSGSYFFRVVGEDFNTVQRITLLK